MSDSTTAQSVIATPEEVRERAAIDRSTRLPVTFFLTSGVAWLLVANLLGWLTSFKMHNPDFLDFACLSWLNWGRLQPAFINALVYGWGFQAAFGIGLWIMARLCRTPLKNPVTLIVAGHVWNIAITFGLGVILFGAQGPGELLEFGRTVWLMLLAAYTIIVVWFALMYVGRPKGADFISQWYLLAAFFWFPWLYLTAQVFTSPATASGLHAAATAAWYSNSLLFLFFVPVGVAIATYLIPKIVGRPLHSYHLAVAGFWSLALFGGWTGLAKLTGGPLPTGLTAVSGAAQVFLLIPALCVAVNHFSTVSGRHGLVQVSPTLRFVFGGAVFYVASHVVAAGLALYPDLSQFTSAWDGFRLMLVYNYFTMTAFGAIYFIMPRISGCEWLSPSLIRRHFWFNIYGGAAISVCLLVSGLSQANTLNEWSAGFNGTVEATRGFHVGATLGWTGLLFANTLFLFHFVLMVLRLGRRSQRATLLPHETPNWPGTGVVTSRMDDLKTPSSPAITGGANA